MIVTNSSVLKRGQGVLSSDLQTLHYNLGGMRNITRKIRGDMVFQK
jgi:hypothetical protein